ncbi:MAG: DNA polymerase III subunit epsilon [Gammaproteobacteria bacterium]|nr:DNA polymerase III subunit epsilon [Gammaproteobacteria bacterium]
MAQRQIILDTETTGLEPANGHRIIEIGCVELVGRRHTKRHYHQYIDPQREIDAGAQEVHGISREFLSDKPRFEVIVDEFLAFIDGAELIIHNAPFDLGFLNHELKLAKHKVAGIEAICTVVDTLVMARHKHPGQRNSLDALCKRYHVDNSGRTLHGALLDSEILADVYLRMTGGQSALALQAEGTAHHGEENSSDTIRCVRNGQLPVFSASDAELREHEAMLQRIQEASGQCVWLASQGGGE